MQERTTQRAKTIDIKEILEAVFVKFKLFFYYNANAHCTYIAVHFLRLTINLFQIPAMILSVHSLLNRFFIYLLSFFGKSVPSNCADFFTILSFCKHFLNIALTTSIFLINHFFYFDLFMMIIHVILFALHSNIFSSFFLVHIYLYSNSV